MKLLTGLPTPKGLLPAPAYYIGVDFGREPSVSVTEIYGTDGSYRLLIDGVEVMHDHRWRPFVTFDLVEMPW